MKRQLFFFMFILCVNFSYSQTWGIVGDATPNGWGGPDIPLVHNEITNIWTGNVVLIDGLIKFRFDNNWDVNYGDDNNDGSIEQNGANILVTAGAYFITLDVNTLTYTIENQFVAIPDPIFEQALLELGIDTDGEINQSISRIDAVGVTELNLNDLGISSLIGIEAFLSLETLYCQRNLLTSIDVSKNSVLSILECESNQFTALNLTHNKALKTLGCANNNLSELDVSENLLLEAIWCTDNNIETLNLDVNTKLNVYGLSNNLPLSNLSIKNGNNHNIVYAVMGNLPNLLCITVDDVTADYSNLNADLGVLFSNNCNGVVAIPDPIFEQALLDLDIDKDGELNQLISVIDAESVTDLNVNDLGIASLNGIEAFSNLGSLYCQRNLLTSIDVSKNSVLSILECESNQFTVLDLSQNKILKTLGCASNNLSELDVSKNLLLEAIWCTDNNIETLNLDVNTKLNVYGLSNNPPLASLSIKNGNNQNIVYAVMGNLPNLSCITVDDETADYTSLNADSGVLFSNNCNDIIAIPDPNFEQALLDLGIDTDGELNQLISRADAESALEININFPILNDGEENSFADPNVTITDKINDLSGIEAFVNVKKLFVGYHALTNIDLSNNLQLNELFLNDNQLTSIDISNNTLLTRFGVMRNPNIGAIDVSNQAFLEELFIENTGISTISLSNNTNLWKLQAQNNNNLITLDLSKNTKLTELRVQGSQLLSYLNVRNGNNVNVSYFSVTNTPNLTCVMADDVQSENMIAFSEDPFSADCGMVYIPDVNFELSLIDIGIDTDGVVNQLISKVDAESVVDTLNLTNPIFDVQFGNPLIENVTGKISDLTGIEAFTKITYLGVGYGELTDIDVSENVLLTELFVGDNQLTSIDVSNNIQLKRLGVMRNTNISSINVSNNFLLEELFIDETAITIIDVSANTNLWRVFARWGNLKGFDLSNNSNLSDIRLRGSSDLSYLNIRNGNNININGFDVRDMPNLGCITADDVQSQLMIDYSNGKTFSSDCGTILIPDENFELALIEQGIDSDSEVNHLIAKLDVETITEVNLFFKNISDLTGIEYFSALEILEIGGNQLTSIDISGNQNLKHIQAWTNQLETLNTSQNPLLEELWLGQNNITELDLSNNSNLIGLEIQSNPIVSIDLSNNINLDRLWVFNSKFVNIDVSKNVHLTYLWASESQFKSLNLSENTALTDVRIQDNLELTSLDLRNGNNLNVDSFNITNTPKLLCINADGIGLSELSQVMLDSGKTFSDDCGDFVNIPDENFELSLLELNIDSDGFLNGKILREDAELITVLNLNNPNFDTSPFANQDLINVSGQIVDLTGIEAFINLTSLSVGYNVIENINVTKNIQLEELYVNDNLLSNIDISENTLLKRFGIMRNPIDNTINVDSNVLLEELFIHETGINTINLENNLNLNKLFLQSNNLSILDISANSNLIEVRCQYNQLQSLDITTNQFLNRLDVQYNSNLVLNTDLVNGNSTLTSLNLSGTGLLDFEPFVELFPNLNWLLLNDNSLTKFDPRQLIALTNLFLNNNAIKSLNLSKNGALVELKATNNSLNRINLKSGTNSILTNLNVTSNNLTCISTDGDDMAMAPYNSWGFDYGVQISLDCKDEPDVVLIPNSNFEQALSSFDSNGLNGNILLSDALLIEVLDVSNSGISNLTGIEEFIALIELNCSGNNLTSLLDLSKNKALEIIDGSANALDSISVRGISGLKNLNVSSNNLTAINLNQNLNLSSLNISNNNLSELVIKAIDALTILDCSFNAIEKNNFEDLINLKNLNASSNLISSLDAQNLSQLNTININSNRLVEFNMKNNSNTEILNFDATNNPDLICITVDNESIVLSGWNKDASTIYTEIGDCIPPVIVSKSIIAELKNSGLVTITGKKLNDGSFDNSTAKKDLIYTVNISEFNCDDIGENIVELSVTDLAGNISTVNVVVTVVDVIAPKIVFNRVKDRVYDLANEINGVYNLIAEDIVKTYTDNCGGVVSLGLDAIYEFSEIGMYNVTAIAEDESGNIATLETTVQIIDTSIVGANTKFGKNIVTVFPVPFTDNLNISFSKSTDLATVSIELLYFDQSPTGIQFYDAGGYFTSDDTSFLTQPSTVYWLVINKAGNIKTVEIVKDN